ncbi:cytosol aminopeptidase-like [Tubulanus polymorphus]|uniref:cytosol aminopeptidase-like n=1 Tax=Tubulanus polymorphus TaxID=672921 RepID=UPI003DA2102A
MMSGTSGLLLGCYADGSLTSTAEEFNSANKELKNIIAKWKTSGTLQAIGKCRILYNFGGVDFLAVVNIGAKDAGYNDTEQIDEGRELVRNAVGVGIKKLQEEGATAVQVDPCNQPDAAAEAIKLALFHFDELKTTKLQHVTVSCLSTDPAVLSEWAKGEILGDGQVFSRRLMELPSNRLTPTIFCDHITKVFKPLGMNVIVRDRKWIEEQKMNAFIGVAKGSDEPPKFLEIHYNGAGDGKPHFAIVGKGICFDAGGICLKDVRGMDLMRADMGGAACGVAAIMTAAKLKLPINVRMYTALCENMPDGKAQKPGDVVVARNGKTIEVLDTDFEGRLTLADALNYAESENPMGILDMATLTLGMIQGVGMSATSGVFTANNQYWELLRKAGVKTGDRVWRMPLWNYYTNYMKMSGLADLSNVGGDQKFGEPCFAAAFLREFVTTTNWVHLDIASVLIHDGTLPYMDAGVGGRPTRTIVEFLNLLSQTL